MLLTQTLGLLEGRQSLTGSVRVSGVKGKPSSTHYRRVHSVFRIVAGAAMCVSSVCAVDFDPE